MKTFVSKTLIVFCLGLSLLSSNTLRAQDGVLKGEILSFSDNKPVFGAMVRFSGVSYFSDDLGRFEINGLQTGLYLIEIDHIAYQKIKKEIPIKEGDNEVTIILSENDVLIEEVVVSGGFKGVKEDIPYKIETISQDYIQKTGAHNLMEALSTVPGVAQISYGPGIGKPVIRGLSFSRIMTLYQGIRFENQQWGEDHGLGLNDLGISKIEILKGPASLLYGSGALGGVINIIDEDPYMGKLAGDFSLRAYSNTLGSRSNIGFKGGSSGGLFYNIRGNFEKHADYLDGDNRIIGNSRYKSGMVKSSVGVVKSQGSSKLSYTYNKQILGIIEEDELQHTLATKRLDYKAQIPYQEVIDHLITFQNKLNLGNGILSANFGHHLNLREENEEDMGVIDLGLTLNTSNYDIKYQFVSGVDAELIFGIQGFRQSNLNMAESQEILLPNSRLYDNSLYGMYSQKYNKFNFQGGLRYDYRVLTAFSEGLDGYILPGDPLNKKLTKTFSGFSGSLGTTFNLSNSLFIKSNLASGFRAPDLAELFSNGEHPGTNRFERGNVNFEREQNLQKDLSVYYSDKTFSFEVATYYNYIRNYVFFRPTDVFSDQLRVWQFEQEDVNLYGGEIGFEIHPSYLKRIKTKHTYAVVRGNKIADASNLPQMPADRIFNEIHFSNESADKYIFVRLQNVFRQARIEMAEWSTPGYTLTSLGFGGSSVVSGIKIDYNIIANNIFNVAYFEHLAVIRPFDIYNMGRNITAGVKIMF
jgi:iron complex outermembrane recepter protein